jgi:hypothetical protein
MNHSIQTLPAKDAAQTDVESMVEKRIRKRERISKDVVITPVEKDLKPLGHPIEAKTKDITTSSVGFHHVAALDSEFFIMTTTMPNGAVVNSLFAVVRRENKRRGRFFTAGILVRQVQSA